MKKPVKAVHPAKGIVRAAPKAKAAQPGNAPGRGKAAHAKAGPAKVPPKKIPPKPKVSAKVKAQRHATALKAAKTRAANVKKAKQHPKRQLALGEGVACCSAEALAASLRLTGRTVSDADVLALYRRTAADLDAGASILATLEAAAEYGLAGYRPLFEPAEIGSRKVDFAQCSSQLGWPGQCASQAKNHATHTGGCGQPGDMGAEQDVTGLMLPAPLLLGLALPAPHAVLDTGSEWITWGQAWPAWAFPDAELEEAWEVTWPGTR